MKKSFLVLFSLLLVFGLASSVYASGGFVKKIDLPDVIYQDNTTASGTVYNTLPALFQDNLIAANKNYTTSVEIKQGTKVSIKLPGQTSFSLQPGANVRIVLTGSGSLVFDQVVSQYNQFVNSKADIYGVPAVVEETGIKVNPKNFTYADLTTCVLVRNGPLGTGCYEYWTVGIQFSMTLEEYNVFITAFENSTNLNKVYDSPIADSKSVGRLIYYK